jgi:hypothetical protein
MYHLSGKGRNGLMIVLGNPIQGLRIKYYLYVLTQPHSHNRTYLYICKHKPEKLKKALCRCFKVKGIGMKSADSETTTGAVL